MLANQPFRLKDIAADPNQASETVWIPRTPILDGHQASLRKAEDHDFFGRKTFA